jgi:mono/diheme cytochrome c family protein
MIIRVFMSKLLSATLTATLLFGAAPAAFAQQDAAQIERGRVAYDENGCYRCHGYAGQGSPGTGPALAGLHLPYEAIDAYIRAPKGEMPPYSKKILSAADLMDITAFVATLTTPSDARQR